MIQSGKDAERFLQEGQPILGKGWKEVETFEDLEDLDEYESDDEVNTHLVYPLAKSQAYDVEADEAGDLRCDGPGPSG
jgi:hypothetical protein